MLYTQWVERLQQILEPSLARKADQAAPWYLRPDDKAFNSKDATDLFAAIRKWWFSGLREPYSTGELKTRLQRVRPPEALPLLYAMSYVARTWGRGGEYWPQFCEHVLEGSVSLDAIHAIAPDLTELWKQLHVSTGGTLFYPTEGRSNIKWPLTHAGLLSDEEQYLQRFGQDLMEEWGSEPHPLLAADVDEFQSALLSWLQEESLSFKPFGKRIRSEQIGLAVAALAQNYLRQIWAQLLHEVPSDATPARQKYRHIRPRLRYDLESNRLSVLLIGGQWSGRPGIVQVEHDGRTEPWPTYYDRSTDTTYAQSVELLVDRPDWGTTVSLRVGRDYLPLPLISSPFSDHRGALLFEGITGNRTRSLQPEESYFLLIPQSQSEAEWRLQLFPDALSIGNPFKYRQGYEVLQVTACGTSTLLKANIDELNDQLIQAAAGFRLPSIGDLTRPRCRLIAGLPLPANHSPAPVYRHDEPPLLEVEGTFSVGLPIALERQVEGALRYNVVSSLRLQPSIEPTRALIALFEGDGAEPGRYRVTAAGESIDFCLSDEAGPPLYRHLINLAFSQDSEPIRGVDFGYHLLAGGRFLGSAWPGARLTLVVRQSQKVDRFTQQLYAEKDGSFQFTLQDFYPGSLPPGPLAVSVEHRLTNSPSLVFTARAYFRRWATHRINGDVQFIGTAVLVERDTPVTAIAFGEAPWAGQIWKASGRVTPDGTVTLRFPATPGIVRYVAVSEGTHPDSEPWLAAKLPGTEPWTDTWSLDGEGTWDEWIPWMETLYSHTGADHEVQQLAAFSRMRRLLEVQFDGAPPPSSGWCVPNETFAADLAVLSKLDSAPRAALVVPPLPHASSHSLTPSGPTPGIPLDASRALEAINHGFPEDGVPVTVAEGHWTAKARVRRGEIPGIAVLVAEESLVICWDCGRILPRFGAEYHSRPHIQHNTTCRTMHQFFPGQSVPTTLAVEYIPAQLASCIAELFAHVSRHRKLPAGMNQDLFQWFMQVAELYPKGPGAPTLTRWGREIAEAAAALTEIRLLPNIRVSADRLTPLIAIYEENSTAVLAVVTRLLKWVEGGAYYARAPQ